MFAFQASTELIILCVLLEKGTVAKFVYIKRAVARKSLN